MDTVSATTLFTIWERGHRLSPSGRSRAVLDAIGIDEASHGRLTVGQRDALLMDLRGHVFGSRIASVAECPACSARMDVAFDLRDIWASPSGEPSDSVSVESEGYALMVRPPNVDDLIWLERCDPTVDRRSALLERCVLDATHGGTPVPAATLPPAIVSRVSAALAEADPLADVRLALTCSECGHAWAALFDIVAFFWQELETWVWRMVRDVDLLAARYGWSEAEILAMTPDRRALYLEAART